MQALPEDKKKLAIYGGIIVVCLAGAIIAYVKLSAPKSGPQATAAEEKMDEITKQMNEANPPPPPEPMPTARRGAVQAK
ncbi:hypothetical protein PHYC_02690 [Phycisphaerales bacterium]|nr:hypothetical protein PHYC_02690 [Phycisphaerales bacterium]